MQKHIIFCYGTLKRGHHAHELLSNASFISEAKTHPKYRLHNMGGFPGMVEAEPEVGGGVSGELYLCDDQTRDRLDAYECISSGLFERAVVLMDDNSTAEAYLFSGHKRRGMSIGEQIGSGVW